METERVGKKFCSGCGFEVTLLRLEHDDRERFAAHYNPRDNVSCPNTYERADAPILTGVEPREVPPLRGPLTPQALVAHNAAMADAYAHKGTLKHYLLKRGFMPHDEAEAEAILDGIIKENEGRS